MKNVLLLLSLFLILGCSDKKQSIFDKNLTVVVHQCNNVWQDFETQENSRVLAVSNFLEANNIEFIDLEETNGGPFIYCTFCYPCPSDKLMNFKVREADLEAVLSLGFEEN